ncbi:mitochondrial distribution and morphology protein 10 [Lasallia pustulata]|uniref:Mitochondrial distribution and morphology protein 10 n=1 Tax=Lasallia pustulata TaxID=136370 RepID=A0A1W5D0Q8_9LECA|nr:mitochondrial distribution and morphology protein 10 [Lasallia pustulata]
MDYVQNAFYDATHWNRDNSYGSLTATARALLDFDTPRGLRLNVSSLSSPNFATSYTLGSIGVVDGSLSYLYSSLPIKETSKSGEIELRHVIQGYRQLQELRRPDEQWWWEEWHQGKRVDKRDALLYGRLFLPHSTLEALYLRRISPTQQLKITSVSDSRLKSGGTILALFQHDTGKYSTEYLYSTDSALLGIRGLYNFGPDPRARAPSYTTAATTPTSPSAATLPSPSEGLHGRFSAGAELYYGLLNKSGGVSTGIRFATLPRHTGFPYTMTLNLNPLMGNLSCTYAVQAAPSLALCSRFDFNVYSYESDLQLGVELWRRRRKPDALDWARAKPGSKRKGDDGVAGVLKARVNQDWAVGVLWEGRLKDLLYTGGVTLDFRRRESPFRAVGLELQYSS